MANFTWNEKYSVGVQKIDEQHKKLFELVNELQAALAVGKGKDVLGKVLKGLADYTVMHFGTEQELMSKFVYPELSAHKKMHDDLVKQVVDLQGKFASGGLFLSTEVMTFLQNWLTHHISETDKKLAKFLNEKGIK